MAAAEPAANSVPASPAPAPAPASAAATVPVANAAVVNPAAQATVRIAPKEREHSAYHSVLSRSI